MSTRKLTWSVMFDEGTGRTHFSREKNQDCYITEDTIFCSYVCFGTFTSDDADAEMDIERQSKQCWVNSPQTGPRLKACR